MYSAPRECPVCDDELILSRLDCRACGTSVQGQYIFGGISSLNAQELAFVEIFVRCEGKLNHMEKELNLSYPTLRARLHAVIKALGYPVQSAENESVSEAERARILDEISSGSLTADQAMTLLEG